MEVAQVAAVRLVARQATGTPEHADFAAEQRLHELVVTRVVVRRTQVLQRLPLPPAPGQGQPEQPPGRECRTTSP